MLDMIIMIIAGYLIMGLAWCFLSVIVVYYFDPGIRKLHEDWPKILMLTIVFWPKVVYDGVKLAIKEANDKE